MGKPYKTVYNKAEEIINKFNSEVKYLYGIGDNPLSDIKGANSMKTQSIFKYQSILIKSVCCKEEYIINNKPDIICDTFYNAVRVFLKHSDRVYADGGCRSNCADSGLYGLP